MFRTLICPSSGACDYIDGLPHRLPCSVIVVCWGLQCFNLQDGHFQTSSAANPNTQRSQNKTTDVVNRQYSRRLLKMDILMFETC